MVVKKNGKSKEERTMKKMMTNMKTLVALLMAGAAVTSCSSDNEMDSPKAPAVKTYTMTVQATKGGDATTRALTDAGSTLTATWATTENVYVMKGSGWANGSLKPQADGATATLKGELSGVTIAANDVLTLQFPKSGDITYAGQKGTLADIAANFDWATATVTVKSVSGGDIIPEAATTTFQHQQAIVKFTLQDKGNSNAAISPSALTINDGTSDIVTLTSIPDATYTTNGAGVLYVALPAVNSKLITLTATVGSDTYTLTTSSAKSFAKGSFYRITAQMTKQASAPEGAISGKFSVSATKQVYFSQGNLQATTTDLGEHWTWAFAANQWDYIGNAAANTAVNGNGTVSANGTVDLFGWVGTSSTLTGAAQYGITSSFYDYGNNASEALKSDWGNTIGSGWYTLSSAEWTYLFKTRTNAASKFVYATVADKVGIIIVPDDFTDPMKNNGSGAFVGSTTEGWTANVYSAENWSAMETAGCVFLPVAGYRYDGTSVYGVGSNGSGGYWSSSPDTSDVYSAYYVNFYYGDVSPASRNYRFYGYSVRLVRPVE
jgi:hypothetical protein